MGTSPLWGDIPETFYKHLVMMVEPRGSATIHAGKKVFVFRDKNCL